MHPGHCPKKILSAARLIHLYLWHKYYYKIYYEVCIQKVHQSFPHFRPRFVLSRAFRRQNGCDSSSMRLICLLHFLLRRLQHHLLRQRLVLQSLLRHLHTTRWCSSNASILSRRRDARIRTIGTKNLTIFFSDFRTLFLTPCQGNENKHTVDDHTRKMHGDNVQGEKNGKRKASKRTRKKKSLIYDSFLFSLSVHYPSFIFTGVYESLLVKLYYCGCCCTVECEKRLLFLLVFHCGSCCFLIVTVFFPFVSSQVPGSISRGLQ